MGKAGDSVSRFGYFEMAPMVRTLKKFNQINYWILRGTMKGKQLKQFEGFLGIIVTKFEA